MTDIDIVEIRKKFSNIIDDIDVLFNSIEKESQEILDQLTNSLKEHNGVKREMRRIKSNATDIANGNIGDDFLKYNFTESFDTSTNINVQRSDPVNYDAGLFTINKDISNILSLEHYRGSKIEFNIVENFAQINEYGYVGSSDPAAMLDQDDPRQLVYRIITSTPTPLKASITLQLAPDASEVEINSVVIDMDSDIAKGYIRLYYKNQFEWKDVNTQSIQEIKSDKVIFNFPNTKTAYIKIEFIKESPDSFDTNTYYYVINNIAISQSTSRRSATLYSKPISVNSYSSETSIINNLTVSGDIDVPPNCDVNVYVAQDIKISGAFLNSGNLPVNYDSSEAYKFDSTYNGYVYLSDIINSTDTITGVLNYKGLDFNWKNIQFINTNFEQVPKQIDFDNTIRNKKLDNSLFIVTNPLMYGDVGYTGILQLSGWVNTSNTAWATMSPLVTAGILVSGIDIATDLSIAWANIEDSSGNLHPSIAADNRYSGQWLGFGSGIGYPFNYTLSGSLLVFNDYTAHVNGWWRPFSETVTPTGINGLFSESGFLKDSYHNFVPDFYFNNTPFYKIYKFGRRETLLDSTVKLYTYQERPFENDGDLYPCHFKWKYKSKFINKVGFKEKDSDPANPASWIEYCIPIASSIINTNEEFIIDSITEVKIHNTAEVLDSKEYQVLYSGVTITGIYFGPLSDTKYLLKPSGITFDYTYLYRTKNEYLSTWTGYAIIAANAYNPYIIIPNVKVVDKNINLINKIAIENLDTGQITDYLEDNGGMFKIFFGSTNTESHFKITLFCASNDDNGYCADNWSPYKNKQSSSITISPNVKLVYKIDPIKLVGLDTLLYNSFTGDQRAAIYEENGEKFIVVKFPSKDTVPGYYFDSINKKYYSDSTKQLDNKGHWVRQHNYDKRFVDQFYYTTGSSGNILYIKDNVTRDTTWNGGATLNEFPNYTGITYYPHHSTYGYPINVDSVNTQKITLYPNDIDPRAPTASGTVGSSNWLSWLLATGHGTDRRIYLVSNSVEIDDINRGFLFFNTGENLSSYYSISYRTSIHSDDTNNRFLYKIVLLSDDTGSLVPKIRSIRFTINEE
jgi:hypothetical protein